MLSVLKKCKLGHQKRCRLEYIREFEAKKLESYGNDLFYRYVSVSTRYT